MGISTYGIGNGIGAVQWAGCLQFMNVLRAVLSRALELSCSCPRRWEVLSNPSFGMMASNLAAISFSFLPEISSCDGSDGGMYLASFLMYDKYLMAANLPLVFIF